MRRPEWKAICVDYCCRTLYFCFHCLNQRRNTCSFVISQTVIWNLPELEPPSASQCDIPNSDALNEFEVPPQSELVKCSEELPSDDKAVNPSIGVGW